jgi:hypothetical protein
LLRKCTTEWSVFGIDEDETISELLDGLGQAIVFERSGRDSSGGNTAVELFEEVERNVGDGDSLSFLIPDLESAIELFGNGEGG